jgi:hypothetical protein
MSDREGYLWDGSGEPDALVRDLEQRLAPLRHRHAPPDWDRAAVGDTVAASVARHGARSTRRMVALAAAVAGLFLGAAYFASLGESESRWRVDVIAGAPRLGQGRLPSRHVLRAGETVVTHAADRARLRLAGVGEVEVAPNSRLRLLSASGGRQSLALDRGAIAAAITARPQLFEVATPGARAIDLGCYFTLEVLPDGRERLRVEAGWVALKRGDREAFVPGGAAVVSSRAELGVPVRLAARELRAAVDRWSALPAGAGRAAALAAALDLAERDDSFTLWHLLAASDGDERARVHDRLAQLAPPPPLVTREGVLAGDATMRDRWWQSLGLGTAGWWREWRVAYPVAAR